MQNLNLGDDAWIDLFNKIHPTLAKKDLSTRGNLAEVIPSSDNSWVDWVIGISLTALLGYGIYAHYKNKM